MAANGGGGGRDPAGEADDWIEVYNRGASAVDVGGMFLTDDPVRPGRWRIPDTAGTLTTVPAGGYLVIWADGQPEQGPLHAPFKLSAGGEEVALFDASLRAVDAVGYPSLAPDATYGRLPDGVGPWQILSAPTPGAANRARPARVVINEIMYHPRPTPGPGEDPNQEYLELFNADTEAVDLAGWQLAGGVDFAFPRVSLAAGGYLVVAASPLRFAQVYGEQATVVGGWSGQLSDHRETLTLLDAAGLPVDTVTYADQGDWALRQLGPVDHGHRGWQWAAAHDGGGASLELVNPLLANAYGANWAASLAAGGTPGRANSVMADDVAPILTGLRHAPAMPASGQAVTVTVRVLDESMTGLQVVLHARPDTSVYADRDVYPEADPASFQSTVMHDDGLHGDGAAGDGVYGALLPAQPRGTVVEFYAAATDVQGQTRTWPAPSWVDGEPRQVTNALYQVNDDDTAATQRPGAEPLYRLILTRAERDRLLDIGDREGHEADSNAQMNVTFISDDGGNVQIRYGVGVRNRGHGSRDDPPNNYRVNFRHDQPWQGVSAVNLNTYYPYVQVLGSALFRLAGLPAAQADLVQVRVNGENRALAGSRMYGSYARLEVPDSDFVRRRFANHSGNLYKCMRMVSPGADLRYQGPEPGPYRVNYFKHTNAGLDDWRDLAALTRVVSDAGGEGPYAEAVASILDVDEWLRALAVNILVANNETTLATGNGDDYCLYNPFPDRPHFLLIPYDLDTTFGLGGNPGSATSDLFPMTRIPALARFLEEPAFGRAYQQALLDLADGVFAEPVFNAVLRQTLVGKVPDAVISQVAGFMTRRIAYVRETLAVDLTADTGLPVQAGYPYTTVPHVDLFGTADPAHTDEVRVQGRPAVWSPLTAQWRTGGVAGGVRDVLVPAHAVWHYFDGYTDLGSDWYLRADGQGWPAGPAQLGYGDGDEATVVGYRDTNPATTKMDRNLTTYFVHRFDVADPGVYRRLALRLLRDDGAVVYLNGHEIARSNMPAGPVTYNTPAARTVSDESAFVGDVPGSDNDFTALDAAWLQTGTNRLAVEIHQRSATSSDISFDLELAGVRPPDPADQATLHPGINRLVVEARSQAGLGPQRSVDVWYDDGDESPLGGSLSRDRTLDATAGPWHVTSDLVVRAGVTLTVTPGATLFFEPDTGITVEPGGCLRLEGTDAAHIHLTLTPGAAGLWDGLRFDRTQEDNRLAYVDQCFSGGQGESVDVQSSRVDLDHVTWSGTDERILRVDHPIVQVRQCVFPSLGSVEPIHGVGLSGDEQLVFRGCVFGTATGYNDIIDFSGGQRPGPILEMYDNVFLGGGDDGLDLDGSDAHIEGNLFAGFHQDNSSDSTANAIATGSNGGQSAHLVVARNVFTNCDHAVLLKEDSALTATNNTFVGLDIAAINFGEPERHPPRRSGLGASLVNNVFWDNTATFQHLFQDPYPDYGPADVSIDSCLLPETWHAFGTENVDADPVFATPGVDLHLGPGSPARGSGRWGLDRGAYVPAGAAISGEPPAVTPRRDADLTVGGPGITAYRYSLNDPNGPWSDARPVAEPLRLTGLTPGGTFRVFVRGRNSAGRWQELPTVSRSWTVDTAARHLQLSEIALAADGGPGETVAPGFIELAYDGPRAYDLTGLRLCRDPNRSGGFTFGQARLDPGAYAVVTLGPTEAGFDLAAAGDHLFLLDRDGTVLDAVIFGAQVPGWAIGRVGPGGLWELTEPTPGRANRPAALGDPRRLRINEWLARARSAAPDDFVELFNPGPRPVALGGWVLTDKPLAWDRAVPLPALTFVAAQGFLTLSADGGRAPGHVPFRLSGNGELIALFDTSGHVVDRVVYAPQVPDVSEGRAPDGADNFLLFPEPTPDGPNPYDGPPIVDTRTEPVFDFGQTWHYDEQGRALPADWTDPAFDDRAWPAGSGLLYVENAALPAPKGTALKRGPLTFYFRTHVVVDDPGAVLALAAETVIDDGAVVYLNGREVLRLGMPAGTIDNATRAARTVGDATLEGPFTLDPAALVAGDNCLAVEVHQTSASSSDIVFGLRLIATRAVAQP